MASQFQITILIIILAIIVGLIIYFFMKQRIGSSPFTPASRDIGDTYIVCKYGLMIYKDKTRLTDSTEPVQRFDITVERLDGSEQKILEDVPLPHGIHILNPGDRNPTWLMKDSIPQLQQESESISDTLKAHDVLKAQYNELKNNFDREVKRQTDNILQAVKIGKNIEYTKKN